jgi:signal transduction histidine kinase
MNADLSPFPAGPGWSFLKESASVVVVRVNRAGTILAANRQARTLIHGPLVGQPWSSLLLNFAGTVTLADWLADEARPRLLNIRTTAGLPQTLEVTVEPVGEDYYLFGEVNAAEQARLGREVLELNHELNNLTRELALKNGELAQLNVLKNQFLGMAAHDLRRPIGVVLSFAEFLLEEADEGVSAEHRDFLQTIHVTAGRMLRVVEEFLDVSLIEAGRFTIDEQPAGLGQLVRAAITLVNLSAKKRGVAIATDLDPASLALFVDGPKIEQVLTNLLSNAVEHSPAGGGVTVSSRRLATEVRVQVADAGPGVSLAQQQRLFQPFASGQARKSTGEGSIGLGLAIARKIVEAHGGRMFVESEPGRGAVFGFTLPASCLAGAAGAGDSAVEAAAATIAAAGVAGAATLVATTAVAETATTTGVAPATEADAVEPPARNALSPGRDDTGADT